MESYGVLVFSTTHDAMSTEKAVKEKHLQARIISTPEQIKASCGFSLKYVLADETQIMQVLSEQKITAEGQYHAQGVGLKMTYQIVKEF
ncbi:DUF3343 domain-containing protein [Vagococcus vulneris]|uniref:Putative Se/S carrier protein-like domain-containing protein n=1 Tax=Vagococcus vulneris TaxID=1977869 RepID=A0A429ZXK6_9ENTE|nr:DUF3343 domain-containing protein [Vagococcus vulneris]RST98594.1 hypothetical protein CBF37_07405 [Vagococcus vulneris]